MPEYQSGQRIDHYTLIEHIGTGGFGEVWKAQDNMLDGRIVALKFILQTVGDAGSEHDLLREQMAISKLTTNRDRTGAANILYINAARPGTDHHHPFLDLEWMAGGTLSERLVSGPPLGYREVLSIARQLTNALVCASSHKIIHCDIKPSNVLLSEDGRRYCLSDFGLARKVGEMERDVWGTPPYMSPEQFKEPETVDTRTDVYSLGVLLYQCAEGTLPFTAESRTEYEALHCSGHVPEMKRAEIPSAFQKIIKDCLRKEMADRPADAKVLSSRLSELGDGQNEYGVKTPPINQLDVRNLGDKKYVRHIDTNIELKANKSRKLYVPTRPPSNKDYYKFMNDSDHLHWKPGVVRVSRHDGGYLQHWFMGRPLQDDLSSPVTCIPYEAADEMAKWFAGQLPTSEELFRIFYADEPHPLAEKYREYMEDNDLECMQFWCRDNSTTLNTSDRKMWVYMPGSQFDGKFAEISRPKYYCFPHYSFIPVVPKRHVVGRDSLDIGEHSGHIPPVQPGGNSLPKSIGSMKKSYVQR